jgi:hypothetical protein
MRCGEALLVNDNEFNPHIPGARIRQERRARAAQRIARIRKAAKALGQH